MPDVFTKVKRSDVMSRIRSRGNKDTELAIIKLFRKHGITGWRRNQNIFGKPDFLFRQDRLALFVDGCFWHGCPRCYRRPGSNKKYWDDKVARNKSRDRRVNRKLRKFGWRVLRIWEHHLTSKSNWTVRRIGKLLNSAHPRLQSLRR